MFGQDKRQVFNPNAITGMNYMPGRHQCRPTGRVVEPSTVEAALLHYKYVEPHTYMLPRQQALARRMLDGDIRSGFGMQYRLAPEQLLESFDGCGFMRLRSPNRWQGAGRRRISASER